MQKKVVGIGIGIGIAVVIVALVFFTNVDDMVSDTISEVEFSNSIQTYEINTKEEYSCMIQNVGPDSDFVKLFQEGSSESFEKKYPNVMREMQEYIDSGQLEKDLASTPSGQLPHRANEIILPLFMNEFSVNPVLEDWLLDNLDGKLSGYEMRQLEKIDCP